MKRILLTTLITLLFVLSCEESSETVPDPLATDYLLYSKFLESDYVQYEDIVLHAESFYGLVYFGLYENYTERYKSDFPRIPDDMLDQLEAVYQDSIYYENKFPNVSKDILIETIDEFGADIGETDGFQDYWNRFLEVYGENSGRVAFSRVAYNETKDEALFLGATFMRVGFGHLVYMKKEQNSWRFERVEGVFSIN